MPTFMVTYKRCLDKIIFPKSNSVTFTHTTLALSLPLSTLVLFVALSPSQSLSCTTHNVRSQVSFPCDFDPHSRCATVYSFFFVNLWFIFYLNVWFHWFCTVDIHCLISLICTVSIFANLVLVFILLEF